MNPQDTDPLTVDWTDTAVEWWDEGYRRGRKARRVDLAVIVLAAFALGCAATILASRVSATSRSEPAPSIPVAAQARSEASPMTLGSVQPPSVPASPAATGFGVRDGGDASLSGTASWYPARGFIAAAGPGLRTGHWRGRVIVVSANGRSVTVTLSDWCLCPRRLIDLSDDAFAKLTVDAKHPLGNLGRGLIHVTVSSAGPAPTPPMTDSAP